MPPRSSTAAGVALLIARMLAQRLNVANTYLADLKRQYAGHGTHLAMVGEVLQSMINLPPLRFRQARIGNPIQGYEPVRRLPRSEGGPLQRRLEVDLLRLAGRQARTPCPSSRSSTI